MKQGRLIFIIDSAFPYQSGGRETWLSEMTIRLSGDYHIAVVSLMNHTAREEPLYDIPGGVRIHRIPTLLNVRMGGRYAAFRQLFGGLYAFSVISAILLLVRYSFPRIPTYVVTMNPGHAFFPALFVLGKKAVRIGCVRGLYVNEMKRLFPGADRFAGIALCLQSICYNKANLILTNGDDTTSIISGEVPDRSRVVTLPNGVDFKRFSKAIKGESKTKVIGMISTLSRLRGTDAAISAAVVLNRRPGILFRLELVGKGDADRYSDLAIELGLRDVVSFRGETKEVDKVLADMDITLALTHGCGISHSLLEEMAAGKAVIALDSPAYRQVIADGVNGLLVPDREPETLANAMERLIKDDVLASKVRQAAQEDAAKYDWSVVERKFRNILSQLSSGKGIGRG